MSDTSDSEQSPVLDKAAVALKALKAERASLFREIAASESEQEFLLSGSPEWFEERARRAWLFQELRRVQKQLPSRKRPQPCTTLDEFVIQVAKRRSDQAQWQRILEAARELCYAGRPPEVNPSVQGISASEREALEAEREALLRALADAEQATKSFAEGTFERIEARSRVTHLHQQLRRLKGKLPARRKEYLERFIIEVLKRRYDEARWQRIVVEAQTLHDAQEASPANVKVSQDKGSNGVPCSSSRAPNFVAGKTFWQRVCGFVRRTRSLVQSPGR